MNVLNSYEHGYHSMSRIHSRIPISAIAILQIFFRRFKCRMSDKTLIYQLHKIHSSFWRGNAYPGIRRGSPPARALK